MCEEKIIKNYQQIIKYLFSKTDIIDIGNFKDNNFLDPIFNLFKKTKEFIDFSNENYFTYLLYLNKGKVHKILYYEEEFISINLNEKAKSLSYLFYLALLINDEISIVNYKYHFSFIKSIYSFLEESNKQFVKKLILSKILIILVYNYKSFDECKEDEEEAILFQMINVCQKNIESILKDLNKLGLIIDTNDIKIKGVDEIYSQIIFWLLKNGKFENYYYAIEIMEQLDIESIKITYIMFKELLNAFKEYKIYMKKYEISKIDDLSDNKKISFYFILFKYILKNPIYIYQIPLLLKSRKNIISILKSNYNILQKLMKNDKRIEYIIIMFLDSEYFINDNRYNNKEEMTKLTTIINDGLYEKELYFKILLDSVFKIEIQKSKGKFIYNYREIAYKNNNKYECIKHENFTKINENKTNTKYFNEYLKLLYFLNSIENKIMNLKDFNNFQLNIELNFQTTNTNDVIFTKCQYKLFNLENFICFETKDENILNNKLEDNKGLILFIDEIKKIIKSDNLEDSISDEYINYSILKGEKIGKHLETAEFIIELNNGLYLSGSVDHILYIYDKILQNIIKSIELKVYPYNLSSDGICQINSNLKNENNIQLFACSKINLFLIEINKKTYNVKTFNRKLENKSFNQCIEIKKNNYIFIGNKGIYNIVGEPIKIIEDKNNKNINVTALSGNYINGIKINENIIAISSNSIYATGEDKLLFFSLEQNKTVHEIKDYSFNTSLNSLSLMTIKNEKNINKILLCACTKYKSNQKNGILLVVPNLKENEKVYHKFYETDFEVHCFCQINKKKDENINNNLDENKTKMETEYFFVGGFDREKGIGVIYLYEMLYDKKKSYTRIDLITEVYSEEINSINCIIQTKNTRNFLICCSDGKVFSYNFNGKEELKKY